MKRLTGKDNINLWQDHTHGLPYYFLLHEENNYFVDFGAGFLETPDKEWDRKLRIGKAESQCELCLHTALGVENRILKSKSYVSRTIATNLQMCATLKPNGDLFTGKNLYDIIIKHLGRDPDYQDIIYLNYHNESYMSNDIYFILKEFLDHCDKQVSVVFITSSSHGVITSDTTQKLFSSYENFYVVCQTTWINVTTQSDHKDTNLYNNKFSYKDHYPKSKTFLGIMGSPRAHRKFALAKIFHKRLHHHGHMSWSPQEFGYLKESRRFVLTPNSIKISEYFEHPDIPKMLDKVNLMRMPCSKSLQEDLDITDIRQRDVLPRIDDSDLEFYNDAYVVILPESQYWCSNQKYFKTITQTERSDINFTHEYSLPSNFFSEKTFKPMINKMPFIMIGTAYNLESLRDLGFKTFHPWINESYDTIKDDYLRIDAIVNELQRLTNNPPDQEWMSAITEICEHNLQKILEYNGSAEIVVTDCQGEPVGRTYLGHPYNNHEWFDKR